MARNINYYLNATYRRKILDQLLEKNKGVFKGIVLDIGGRDRGKFKKPKEKVSKWIFADISLRHNPELILDVCEMKEVENESIDTILAAELFEHVKFPEKGIRECHRALRDNGTLVVSAPFLFYIHADPYDYQRWTEYKWKQTLEETGFRITSLEAVGGFFSVLTDMIKSLNKSLPKILKLVGFFFYPLLDIIQKLDKIKTVKNNKILKNFTTGYFIIATKERHVP